MRLRDRYRETDSTGGRKKRERREMVKETKMREKERKRVILRERWKLRGQ